jgi:serine/threonine protein kinase
MSFPPGTKLDSYEILSLLGAGGMGEVYRARDAGLRREVAIKVLPSFVSQNPDRLRRFEQEAQATAALNHPNILHIYQFGMFDGAPYLVYELLEGETLRQQLDRGPVPIRRAIEIAVQVAHGLSAAHDKGIVHRDLKPENLFVLKEGRIKILDFGLAKLMQAAPEPSDSGDGSDLTRGTDPGQVMGTASYMAPEQVRGHALDHRADIFAFGAILYEMLTGRRAFKRSTSAETMSAILNEDPAGVSQITQTVPPALQRVVYRCLEKNPAQRFQSASDLAFALESLSESGSTGAYSAGKPAPGKVRRLLPWAAGGLMLALLVSGSYLYVKRNRHIPFEHFSIQRAMDSEHVRLTAISPDGKYLASIVEDPSRVQSLIVRQIATNTEAAILKDPAYHYRGVYFSPDDSYVYLWIAALGNPPPNRDDVYRISVLGGAPERVLQGSDGPLSFIDGGQRLCIYRENDTANAFQFLSTSAEGGDEKVLASGRSPLPEQTACDATGSLAILEDELGEVEVLDFAAGTRRKLISLAGYGGYLTDPHWLPGNSGMFGIVRREPTFFGQLAYISYPDGKLREITNDLSSYGGISLTGDGRTIATRQTDANDKFSVLNLAEPSHLEDHGPAGLRHFSWIDNQTIVASDAMSTLRMINLSSDEAPTLHPIKDHWFIEPDLCGSDSFVSVGGTLNQSMMRIYKMNRDGSQATELTHGPYDVYPVCTNDGKWLFYADNHGPEHPVIMRLSMSGGQTGGTAVQIAANGGRFRLSSDGKLMATIYIDGQPHLEIYSTDTLKKLQSFALPHGFFHSIAFSPDNKAVYYPTMTGPDSTIWLQPLDSPNAVKVTSLPGKQVEWMRLSPDGTRMGLILESPQSEAVLLRETK